MNRLPDTGGVFAPFIFTLEIISCLVFSVILVIRNTHDSRGESLYDNFSVELQSPVLFAAEVVGSIQARKTNVRKNRVTGTLGL